MPSLTWPELTDAYYEVSQPTPRPAAQFMVIAQIRSNVWAVLNRQTNMMHTMTAEQMRDANITVPATAQSLAAERKKHEKKVVKEFFETGRSVNLNLTYNPDNGALVARGLDLGDTNVLFTISNGKIYAQAKRTKHIKKLLEALAEREGWTVEWLDEPLVNAGGRSLQYYAFTGLEIDDSATISGARFRGLRGNEHPDRCGPDCEECYSEDEDEDEDW